MQNFESLESVATFLSQNCAIHEKRHVKRIRLFRIYNAWCVKNNRQVEALPKFYKLVHIILDTFLPDQIKKSEKYFSGIMIKP